MIGYRLTGLILLGAAAGSSIACAADTERSPSAFPELKAGTTEAFRPARPIEFVIRTDAEWKWLKANAPYMIPKGFSFDPRTETVVGAHVGTRNWTVGLCEPVFTSDGRGTIEVDYFEFRGWPCMGYVTVYSPVPGCFLGKTKLRGRVRFHHQTEVWGFLSDRLISRGADRKEGDALRPRPDWNLNPARTEPLNDLRMGAFARLSKDDDPAVRRLAFRGLCELMCPLASLHRGAVLTPSWLVAEETFLVFLQRPETWRGGRDFPLVGELQSCILSQDNLRRGYRLVLPLLSAEERKRTERLLATTPQ